MVIHSSDGQSDSWIAGEMPILPCAKRANGKFAAIATRRGEDSTPQTSGHLILRFARTTSKMTSICWPHSDLTEPGAIGVENFTSRFLESTLVVAAQYALCPLADEDQRSDPLSDL